MVLRVRWLIVFAAMWSVYLFVYLHVILHPNHNEGSLIDHPQHVLQTLQPVVRISLPPPIPTTVTTDPPVTPTTSPDTTLPPTTATPLTHIPRGSKLHLVVFSTLKPCVGPLVHTQYNAVMSWTKLPLDPSPTVILFGGGSDIANIAQRTGAIHVPNEAIDPETGTALLGKMIQYAKRKFPKADVYGFCNGDIVFPSFSAFTFQTVHKLFSQYFLIGHRFTVKIDNDIDYSSRDWETEYVVKAFSDANKDRKDAEDYFFWSNGFFKDREIPDFYIGRPAYDNWFVHHAIHTNQPVIDATEGFLPLHQRHDYSHLKNSTQKYWGSLEQEKNYNMALSHGGWQHGLVEFSPFRISPTRCGANANLISDLHNRAMRKCSVVFRAEWRPLKDGQALSDVHEMYRKFVRNGMNEKYSAGLMDRGL